MATYVRGFIIPDVVDVHEAFQRVMVQCDRLILEERRLGKSVGAARALADIRIAYRDFNLGLRNAAEKAAERAMKGMIERLDSTRRRAETGSSPAIRDLVEANPLNTGQFQTGAVGVANVELLNRAINPHSRGYGTYWRALEYGTGQGQVPSQVGRILYGSFTAAGGTDPTPPMAEFAGGGGPHPVFRSGGVGVTSVDGERTIGLGTIGKEIEAKHFIKYGADEAAVQWRAEIAAVQSRALDELRAIRLGGS